MDQFAKKFPWEELITKVYSLEDVGKALDDVASLCTVKALIKPNCQIILRPLKNSGIKLKDVDFFEKEGGNLVFSRAGQMA